MLISTSQKESEAAFRSTLVTNLVSLLFGAGCEVTICLLQVETGCICGQILCSGNQNDYTNFLF